MTIYLAYQRKSTGEISRYKYCGKGMYLKDDGTYMFGSTLSKYYVRLHKLNTQYVITPNGFKVQLNKANYDTHHHLERSTPNAKKPKSPNSTIIQETDADKNSISETIRGRLKDETTEVSGNISEF